jgi:hypothetical protein
VPASRPAAARPLTVSASSHADPPLAKTIASLFLDSGESSFANSSERTTCHVHCASDSQSTESEAPAADDFADAIVRGLRSDDRLLFEPHGPSSSILERKPPTAPTLRPRAAASSSSFVDGVAVAFDSADPYHDFWASMQEMVAAHGMGD